MNYKYIVFNETDNKTPQKDDGYYSICMRDLEKVSNVEVLSFPLEGRSKVLQLLFRIHNSRRLNSRIVLPLKCIWYPLFFSSKIKKHDYFCVVISCDYISTEYVKYIKRRYPNARIVKVYRDLVPIVERRNKRYSMEKLQGVVDLNFSYDSHDAVKYKMIHFDEFGSYIPLSAEIAKEYPISDVFFAGKAKDRLPLLTKIYSKMKEGGLKCLFFVTGASEEEKEQYPELTYLETPLSYLEMLYHTNNTKCLLEINQKDSIGYTSRFLEAVMYNKKLLTNNKTISDSCFFRYGYISLFNDENDIDLSFVSTTTCVDYHYNNEFSPIHLLERIDSELVLIGGMNNHNE